MAYLLLPRHKQMNQSKQTKTKQNNMMTSSNGNIFRVTGHLCGNLPITGEFPAQRPVTRSFDVFFDLCPYKRLSKQSWGWWFETLSRPLWRHRNELEPRVYFLECIVCPYCTCTEAWCTQICSQFLMTRIILRVLIKETIIGRSKCWKIVTMLGKLYKKYDVTSVLTLNDGAFAVTISAPTVVVPKPENSGSLVRPVDIVAGASAPCVARSEAVMESTV